MWKTKGGNFVMENLIFRLEDFYCDFYLFFFIVYTEMNMLG